MDRPYSEIEPADPPLGLTEAEREFFDFLHSFVEENRRWPSYNEMMDRFGWSSPNSVAQRLKSLYSKGWIERRERGEWFFLQGRCPFCAQEIN